MLYIFQGYLFLETKRDKTYVFQAVYRTKCALKIMKESEVEIKDFTNVIHFVEWTTIFCGGSEAEDESDLLTCGRCKVMKYCNVHCKKKHWKEGVHKERNYINIKEIKIFIYIICLSWENKIFILKNILLMYSIIFIYTLNTGLNIHTLYIITLSLSQALSLFLTFKLALSTSSQPPYLP